MALCRGGACLCPWGKVAGSWPTAQPCLIQGERPLRGVLRVSHPLPFRYTLGF
ncbi:MAG: hypothetical protein AAF975_03845 [Spirochaetota bacterium]